MDVRLAATRYAHRVILRWLGILQCLCHNMMSNTDTLALGFQLVRSRLARLVAETDGIGKSPLE